MVFSLRLPLPSLIELCRVLRHNLAAGLTLRDVFRQQASRGPLAVRPLAERILAVIDEGDSLETALKREKAAFPPLFLALARVGEETGTLPEMFGELEKYFLLQQRLKRQFVSAARLPVLQLLMAIFVIAGMQFFLGVVNAPFDPIGVGLGAAGALRFLAYAFGTLALLIGAYLLAARNLQHKALVDGLLLRLPAVGPCLQALALTRFCLALRLTMETGMSMARALRLSLQATGNAAFESRSEVMEQAVRAGDDLTVALAKGEVFPEDFQNIVAVAEEGGRVPEIMRHQADYYQEEAGRRLTTLTTVAGFGVWLTVALLMIIVIFRIFLTAILPAYNAG
jgi:type IV pilus assembly protein PilC